MTIANETLKSSSQRQCAGILAAVLFMIVCAVPATATTLSEYRQRIQKAVTALDTLKQIDEDETEEDHAVRTRETITAIGSAVRRTERVEWRGEELNVDNRWLHQEFEKLEQAPKNERAGLLARISERLQAIEDRLAEAEGEGAPALLTKSEASARLDEILNRPQYAKKIEDDSALKRYVNQFLEWLRQILPGPQPLRAGSPSIFSTLVQIFVVLLALAAIVYAARIVTSHIWGKRGLSRKKARREPRIVLGEKLEPDQHAIDLLAEAEALARRGELRAAIRKAYIALLLELGERKVISLEQHKTNRDYLEALKTNESLYEGMKLLTRLFEAHWYGFSKATEDDWQAFLTGYRRVVSR